MPAWQANHAVSGLSFAGYAAARSLHAKQKACGYAHQSPGRFIIKFHACFILTGSLLTSLPTCAAAQTSTDLHPRISFPEALQLVAQHYSQDVQAVRLIRRNDTPVYEVTLYEGDNQKRIFINADTGEFVAPDVQADAENTQAVPEPESGPVTAPLPSGWIALRNPSVYVNYSTGQLAGMNNAVLKPKETVGTRFDLTLRDLPELETHADLYGIYGTAQSSTGTSKSGLQEMRGEFSSIYDFYNQNQRSKAGLGFYSEFAVPLRNNLSYAQTQPSGAEYSAEESDRQKREFLYGIDLKISSQSERISSSLNNILFLGGTRIAPNLLTYKPLLGMIWHNDFYFLGNTRDPKLRFFTDVNMYFARKAGAAIFNAHDGIGGTKRELYISYGVGYSFNRHWELSLRSYGFNNLNRGNSQQTPTSFRDGFILGTEYRF